MKALLLSIAAAALLPLSPLAAAAVTLPPAAESITSRFDPGVKLSAPTVRIGLSTADDQVRVGAKGGGFRILEGMTGGELWPGRAGGSVLVVPEGGAGSRVEQVFRVQVGSFSEQAPAEEMAAEMARESGLPADATWQASRGVWRVRVGRAPRRADLQDLLGRLRRGPHPDAWIVSEPRTRLEGGALRVLDETWEPFSTGVARLVFAPREGARLTIDGKPYRGLIEVLLDAYGRLMVVNEVGLEDYLRGVVPEELGPGVWPELEALKAQAVAARTYVLGNLGQYREEGYDICDTPRCQVYGGAGSEHPMTDRAVKETAGRILVYEGHPINAMYTSTCGGHTEDVEVVFPDMAAPYLRGVPTLPPPKELRRLAIRVRGKALPASPGPAGPPPEPLALGRLIAAGIAPVEALDGAWRGQPLTSEQALEWTEALARLAGVGGAIGPFPGRPVRLELWRWLWRVLGLGEPGMGQVGPADAPWVLGGVEDLGALSERDRTLIAALVARRIVRLRSSGSVDPAGEVRRGEFLEILSRLAGHYSVAAPRKGSVRGERQGRLVIKLRRSLQGFAVRRPPPLLLEQAGGRWHWSGEIELLPGDHVRFIDDGQGRLLLLAVIERRSASDDRLSKRYRWEKVRSRAELEASLADVAPVGRLENVRILGRGISGRVSAIEVQGSEGRARIEGFRLRRALDLPETLFSLELQREPDGLVRRVIFSGRGWGHGVGLCQVGAYGMALRGADYKQILHHYYTGVRLERPRLGR